MNYIINGRFQPFSNANIEELRWVLDEIGSNDSIVFGIVNPNPTLDRTIVPSDYHKADWSRFNREYNPLSFWHRYEIIKIAIEFLECEKKIKAIVPLPERPSVSMQKIENFLPDKNIRTICTPVYFFSKEETAKVTGVKNQDESILKIPAHSSFQPIIKGISSELISSLIALGDENWENFILPQIKSYLQENNFVRSISKKLSRQVAKETLIKIYKDFDLDTKKNYWDIIGKYLPNSMEPSNIINPPFNEVSNNEELLQKIFTTSVKILNKAENLKSGIEDIKSTQKEIIIKLNSHYEYLLERLKNNITEKDIQNAVKRLNNQQTKEIAIEIGKWFVDFNEEMDEKLDEKLKEICNDIKQTDDVQMRLKLSIPFIKLLGIDFETDIDIKNKAKKIFEKLGL